MELKKYDKVIAVSVATGEFRKDIGKQDSPRMYTVEAVNSNSFKLFQVTGLEHALWFNLETGLPQLELFSRKSDIYKNWKNWKITNETNGT
jgi:hypothetical protein